MLSEISLPNNKVLLPWRHVAILPQHQSARRYYAAFMFKNETVLDSVLGRINFLSKGSTHDYYCDYIQIIKSQVIVSQKSAIVKSESEHDEASNSTKLLTRMEKFREVVFRKNAAIN
ncbi:hypothetical protein M514_16280 [Trichuris suis]|uniref:Uncharacterized protein n=1 Tax=Trichuris suis TaxID=68888 RepID=A0A085NPF2_9BILA|nr:hypothetical protein M514_16280 [Trichuris suis]